MTTLKTVGVLGALVLSALSTSAFANESYMRVKVPFAFVVAGQPFAPGDYVVKQNDAGVILVQGAGKGAMVISRPAASGTSHTSALRFTNAQQQVNLTTVEQDGLGARSIPIHAVEQRTLTLSSR